jgi:hypothetical protein
MKRLITKILNLPGVIVEESLETKETIIYQLSSKIKQQFAHDADKQAAVYIKIKRT